MNMIIYPYESYYTNNFGTHLIKSLFQSHGHDFWEGFYVVNGSCEHMYEDTKEILFKGELYLIPPKRCHSIKDIDEKIAIHRDFAFKDAFFQQICQNYDNNLYNDLLNYPMPILLSESSFNTLEELFHNYSLIDKNDVITIKRFAISIANTIINLIIAYKSNPTLPKSFNSILTILKRPIILENGIDALCKESGYSQGHLSRLFKKYLNETLNNTLIKYRMEYATSLLLTTNFSILDIAAMTGYESISHFIKVFKSVYSVTPYVYRIQQSKQLVTYN